MGARDAVCPSFVPFRRLCVESGAGTSLPPPNPPLEATSAGAVRGAGGEGLVEQWGGEVVGRRRGGDWMRRQEDVARRRVHHEMKLSSRGFSCPGRSGVGGEEGGVHAHPPLVLFRYGQCDGVQSAPARRQRRTPSECLLSSFSVRRSRDMCEHYASCTSVDFIFQLRARPHGGGDRSESCDEAE
ncbi:hypothetical protein BU14_0300s0027 [Porphyra umbilicalis]|uniref:Uncharacterized protein n=1 Tax=Porphyra umbilicalis TaxID=2786 RepID=A0A1X6P0E3_PORUM|nr:hypothetical protein BU14_0300s0027 [Porphyra umbilicalis]|eukprot:OSX74230.1 hypothetical protein BU14_0300s0027 [Porphyra umbilicalis]